MPSIDQPTITETCKQQPSDPMPPENNAAAGVPTAESPNVAADSDAAHPASVAAGFPVPASARRLPKTAARTSANRTNAKKFTGPRTVAGKRRAARNLPDPRASRLMGLVEARVLNQKPGAAEKLYREITRVYEPVPPLLAMHFHDLARLHLELEAWERIRDAQIEERWRQSDIQLRRNLHNLQHACTRRRRKRSRRVSPPCPNPPPGPSTRSSACDCCGSTSRFATST